MSSLTVLLTKLLRCDTRWGAAVNHRQYRDPPVLDVDGEAVEVTYDSPEADFSPAERRVYEWALRWRSAFHHFEEQVLEHIEFRQYVLDTTRREEPVQYRYDRYWEKA